MREVRLTQMENYIREHKSVSLETLCEVFGLSMNTVRRDVKDIIARTNIRKIYGGVSAQIDSIPPSFSVRLGINAEAKALIGMYAAQMVEDNDIIYIDSGTTTCQMVDYLHGKKNITIVTPSLDVINRAVSNPELTIVCLPGSLNRETFSFTDQTTIDALQNCNIAKAFMAANGITIQNGATQSTPLEFAIKRSVVAHSSRVILMMESRKIGSASLYTYCSLKQINTIISEKQLATEFRTAFQDLGGTIVTPGRAPEPNGV